MSLQLEEVTSEADFDRLVPLLWRAYGEPRVSWLPLTFGVVDEEGDDESASDSKLQQGIARCRQYFVGLHGKDPTSRWLKVTDTASGEIVGGCRWHFYKTNPYENMPATPPINITVWPEGDRREYANTTMRQFFEARRGRYKGPYMGPQVLFVHPEHRRRGVASMMMDWGLAQGDELGLQSFVESTPWAVDFYKSKGYVLLSTDRTDLAKADPSADWKFMLEHFEIMDTSGCPFPAFSPDKANPGLQI